MTTNTLMYKSLAQLSQVVIRHSLFNSAYEKLKEAYLMNEEAGIVRNYMLVGPSGTGKSTLKMMILKEYPPRSHEEKEVIPVLTINTPAIPTVKNMSEAILCELGDPVYQKGSAIEKTVRIIHLVKQCEVKLIILDELQHFIDQGNKRTPHEVSDWLKTIIDSANVSTILMGLPRSELILEVNPQLRRRFSRRIDMKPFSIENKTEYLNFTSTLNALSNEIILGEKLHFKHPDIIKAMHFATNGIIDYIVKLITGAYQIALESGYSSITQTCLEKAFSEYVWSEGKNELNPFNKNFNGQRLTKRGMPFCNYDEPKRITRKGVCV